MATRLRLGVNIDHVATIRNARGGPHPDPVRAAIAAAAAGADGITAHLREDRRHITDHDIDRLMAELREAMNDFLREFAERAMKNQDQAQQMPQNGQELRQSDLQRMLDQIEDLAKSGNRDKARDLLARWIDEQRPGDVTASSSPHQPSPKKKGS